jgi:hypothetical protein
MNSCIVPTALAAAVWLFFSVISHFVSPMTSAVRESQLQAEGQFEHVEMKRLSLISDFYESEVDDGRYRVWSAKGTKYKDQYDAVIFRIQGQNGRFVELIATPTTAGYIKPGDDVIVLSKSLEVVSLKAKH